MARKPRTESTPGPKPTVDDRAKANIIGALFLGLSLADALILNRISHRSFRRARQADREFAQGIKAASIQGKVHHLKRVSDGTPAWQSSAWFLERKYGAEYGQKVRQEHTGKDGERLAIEFIEIATNASDNPTPDEAAPTAHRNGTARP